jgi:V8-like Glu-specific endopeptidase
MNLKPLSLLILLLILITACGKKSTSDKRVTPIVQTQIQEVMANQRFECASLGGICPAGMSRLFILNPFNSDESAVCSGFMISGTRLVTNHHCVSTDFECANTYIAIYNGANYEQTKCKSIVKTEEDVEDPNDPSRKLDFTVMEIENVYAGEHFKLSGTLADVGDLIHAWVIDHTGLDKDPINLTDSRITEFECRVIEQDDTASLMMMKCPIISGNSGSPALNTNGNVIGVIWGGTSGNIDSSYNLDLRRELDEYGVATEVNYFREYVTKN